MCVPSPPSGRRLLSPCLLPRPSCVSYPFSESKELLPKPGLASPNAGGAGRLLPVPGSRRGTAQVQPGPAVRRPVRRLRVSRRGSGLYPRPTIPGRVTRWSNAPGMRLPGLGGAAPGPLSSSYSSPLLTKRSGEKKKKKSWVKKNCIARFKLQTEIFFWSAHGFFFSFSQGARSASAPAKKSTHILGVFHRTYISEIFKGIAADFFAVHPK